MSQENLELYRRGIEAFNRRDLDGFLALAHPDVVGVSRVLAIEGGPYRGHDGVRAWWKGLLEVFPDFFIEILWVRDGGPVTVAGGCRTERLAREARHSRTSFGKPRNGAMHESSAGKCIEASETPSKPPGCPSSVVCKRQAAADVVLKDGSTVHIRVVTAADEGPLRHFLERLDPTRARSVSSPGGSTCGRSADPGRRRLRGSLRAGRRPRAGRPHRRPWRLLRDGPGVPRSRSRWRTSCRAGPGNDPARPSRRGGGDERDR